ESDISGQSWPSRPSPPPARTFRETGSTSSPRPSTRIKRRTIADKASGNAVEIIIPPRAAQALIRRRQRRRSACRSGDHRLYRDPHVREDFILPWRLAESLRLTPDNPVRTEKRPRHYRVYYRTEQHDQRVLRENRRPAHASDKRRRRKR